jgi:hypothetical protein
MIRNRLQYRITADEAEKFARALEQAGQDTAHLDPVLRRAIQEALESKLEELRVQLAAYEARHPRKPAGSGSAGNTSA